MLKTTRFVLLAVCVPAVCAALAPASACASVGAPQWTVTAYSTPTSFAPVAGSGGLYRVDVQNTGGASSDGSTVTIADALPAGLKASGEARGADVLTGTEASCVGVTCTYAGSVAMDDLLELTIPVEIVEGAQQGTQMNVVTVSGGGAPEAVRETPTTISSTPASFGFAPGSTATALSTSQAGAHPDLTSTLAFNTLAGGLLAGNPDDSGLVLPPGFVGDLADTPKCPIAAYTETQEGKSFATHCPLSTQIGTARVRLAIGEGEAPTLTVPVYNLETNPGEIARLGLIDFYSLQGTVSLEPGKYGVRTVFQHLPDNVFQVAAVALTIWGVPADVSHDAMRGITCPGFGQCVFSHPLTHEGSEKGSVGEETFAGYPVGYPAEDQPQIGGQRSTVPPVPYLTSPTDCTGQPLVGTFEATSWEEPTEPRTAPSSVGPFTGCGLLEFAPAITAAPDTTRGDTPAGFTFGVRMDQEGLLNESVYSESDVQNTAVTLPEGVAVNPGQASGLGACQLSQDGVGVEGPPSCPSDSKVGQVEVETPILKNKLDGSVYLLQSNPPDLKLLVAPEDSRDGLYVKFVGDVHLNEATGRLVTTFEETPQLPFSGLKLSFSGGAQAALVTPLECGTYTTTSDFTPWSTPFVADASPSGAFGIESGPGGSACPSSPPPFSPSMDAGATTDQAGGFTDFSLLLTRQDGQQRISTLQFKTPEGLLGMIAKVPLCGEPQASKGECPASSQIGHTVVESGPGPYPLVVPQPGKPPAPIYLTGPYKGAPFGLSIVVPLEVGPFVLQTQVVRAKIEVDPYTAQVTITTDPLPSIIDGIPSDLRTINAVIDRPEFMFNPTNCSPMSFSGTATSTEGASVPISTRFQVGSCRSLTFKPGFKVSTSAKTSRVDGASLDAKLVYPTAQLGDNQASSQSNIASVKVELPKQLPSRLTTLQKACPDSTFNANPAACPPESRVGYAVVHTPVLPVPLEGPAIFVSHGDEAFPSLTMVLQGYGVTVELTGDTFIENGVTSSTFKAVPDVPFNTFELTLPQGKYSALTANGSLCKLTKAIMVKKRVKVRTKDGRGRILTRRVRKTVPGSLVMPTAFVAQNGAEVHENTPIEVTGCSVVKARTNAGKTSMPSHRGKRGSGTK